MAESPLGRMQADRGTTNDPEGRHAVDNELRIVVVDDMPDFAESLASFLRLNGHEVYTAYGGREALHMVETHRPHCVLLDLNMPEMSGRELARQLRARHDHALVLVAITADDIDVALSPEVQDVDHCLRKPLQMAELAKLLPLPLAARAVPGSANRPSA